LKSVGAPRSAGTWFPRALFANLLLAATMHGMRPVVSYRALALDAAPSDIGLIAASYGILALVVAVPAAGGSIAATLGRMLRVPSMPHALLASFAVLSTLDIIVAYLPVYGVANAIPAATVGLLLATRGGASMVSRLFMRPLRRQLSRRRLLIGSVGLPALMLLALPLMGGNLPAIVAIMVVVGFGLGLGQPLTMSWVATRVPFDIRGTAMGVRLSANRLGQSAVPATVGIISGVAGLTAIFWALAAMLGVAGFVISRAQFDAPGATDTTIASS
jgi:predicted MFS family arabinose efflux permease